MATLVKTVQAGQAGQGQALTIPVAGLQVKTAMGGRQVQANPQQMQMIQRQILQQRAAKTVVAAAGSQGQQQQQQPGQVQQQQPKLAFSQVGGKGMPTQLIVSSGGQNKLPQQVTVQQIQQISKALGGSIQQISTSSNPNLIPHVLKQGVAQGAAAAGQAGQAGQTLQARVVPVSSAAAAAVAAAGGRQQQQIQVVAAGPSNNVVAAIAGARPVAAGAAGNAAAGAARGGAAPNVTIDASGLPAGAAAAGGALQGGQVKVASTAAGTQLLSQLSYVQPPISVAVRSPVTAAQLQQQQGKLQVVNASNILGQQQPQPPSVPTSKAEQQQQNQQQPK